MKKPATGEPNYPIESVNNALRLLMLFRDRPSVRVAEASDELEVARSTAHRLLAMLQFHGFVRKDPLTRVYRAGPTLIDVGLTVVRNMDIRRQGLPIIQHLSRELDETVHIAVPDGREVLMVVGVESTRTVRIGDRTGVRLPMSCTAAGKAILSRMADDDVAQALAGRLPRITPASLTRRADLEIELEEARRAGYATNVAESERDLIGLAAPVLDSGGHVHGAVTVTAPTSRAHPPDWFEAVHASTIAAAEELGLSLS